MGEITEVKDVVEEKVVETEGAEETEQDDVSSEEDEHKPLFLMDEPEDTGDVPLPTFLKMKGKFKGQVKERDVKIEELEAKMQTIEASVQKPTPQPLKRPRERDFETDEEYDTAVDKYEDERFSGIQNNLTQKNTQRTQEEQQRQDTGRKLDEHYTRAADFCTQQKIDPTVYEAADSKVRQAVEAIRPREGNQAVDFLISKLGKDSEKVMLYLGSNDKRLQEFQSVLLNDPSGMEAIRLLGEFKSIVNKTKKTSQAPAPATHVNGDVAPTAKTKATKKAYDKAEGQEAYLIKKQAKADGVDTKEW